MKIINATVKNAGELLEIYAPYVENTAVTFEYSVPSLSEFEQRIDKITQKYPYLMASEDGRILGYAYASEFKDRAAYAHAVEISVYVAWNERERGVGKILYHEIEQILAKQNVCNVNACVACTDTEDEYLTNASVVFHKKVGYKEVGKFHKIGYKFGRWYDMVWLEKQIAEHTPDIGDFIPFNMF